MKLVFDPQRHVIVTENGDVIDDIMGVDIKFDPHGMTATITLRVLAVTEVPDVSPWAVTKAIEGLSALAASLDVDSTESPAS